MIMNALYMGKIPCYIYRKQRNGFVIGYWGRGRSDGKWLKIRVPFNTVETTVETTVEFEVKK